MGKIAFLNDNFFVSELIGSIKIKRRKKKMKSKTLIVVLILIFAMTLSVFADSSESYTWKLGYNTVEDSVRGVAAKKFKEVVEEKTNGRIKIEIYPAETLGPAREQVEAVKVGAQDFQLVGNGTFSPVVDEYNLYSIPFMFNGVEEGLAFSESEIAQSWGEKAFERGYKILATYDLGFNQITNNVRAIRKPEDFKGILLRANPADRLNIKVFKQLGAAISTMAYSEVYMGLQTGVVDGQFNPLDAIYETKFHEVQDYLTMINLQWYTFLLSMTAKTWSNLDEETQAILLDAAKQARETAKDYTTEKTKEYLELVENEFKEITFITGEGKAAFKEKLQPIYEELRTEYEDIEDMEKWLEDYRKSI